LFGEDFNLAFKLVFRSARLEVFYFVGSELVVDLG